MSTGRAPLRSKTATQRQRFFPWRYGMFLALLPTAVPLAFRLPWHMALLSGFDIAAIAFIISLGGLTGRDAPSMRANAKANDANRELMLLLTGVTCLTVLTAVALELTQRGGPSPIVIALIIGTLILAWLFSNLVYALHYAHIFYLQHGGEDRGGIDFPGTKIPDYWDFIYFSFTLGMTFQTSDVEISSGAVRRVVTFHCLAAFVFNLGVIAFTVNVLGGG